MSGYEIVNLFFERKGGPQFVECQAPGGGTVTASQVIYITIKQANWLSSKRTRINHLKHHEGEYPGGKWILGYPVSKNSRQKAANLQIVLD